MQIHCPAPNVRPIIVRPDDTTVGPRIGGNAPEGVVPPKVSSLTQYFVTVSLGEKATQEVSLFVSLHDDWETPDHCMYRNIGKLFAAEDFVQVVVHPKSKRSESAYVASLLGGRGLDVKAEARDIIVEPGGELLLPSKIGGRPYFYYGTLDYIESVNRLLDQGFMLFLQLTWAGVKLSPPGPWPFDRNTFHLLAKDTPDGIIWRYGWG